MNNQLCQFDSKIDYFFLCYFGVNSFDTALTNPCIRYTDKRFRSVNGSNNNQKTSGISIAVFSTFLGGIICLVSIL